MQAAAPARSTALSSVSTAHPSHAAALRRERSALAPLALPSVGTALRVVEALLMNGGQRTARRNAWACVLEDRRRAKDRVETQRVLAGLDGPGTPHGASAARAGATARMP